MSELLASVAGLARAVFAAQAASIALLDHGSGELVFAAAVGEGTDGLVGRRLPAGTGLAGTVAQTGEPLLVEDLSRDPRFAREVAEATGFVPKAIMVAPLLRDERTLGVMSVLDRGETGRGTLNELELLVGLADHAALAADLDERAADAAAALGGDAREAAMALDLVRRLNAAGPGRRESGQRLLAALAELLS